MKIIFFVIAFLTIVGHQMVSCQDDDEERAFKLNSILPPTGLTVFNSRRTTSSVAVGWTGERDVTSYVLRVYTRSDGVLYKEIRNIVVPLRNITGLMDGTEYGVTVSAILTGGRGQTVESTESDPVFIQTVQKCKGGQVRTQCAAHCVSTCDNPDPICSRICTSGCTCPRSLPIWHDGNCLPRQLCPPPRGSPVTPKNVRVLPSMGTDEVFLTWEPVDNAMSYTVRVKLAVNRNEVVNTLESAFPLVSIPNLAKGEIYIFSVKANMRKPAVVSARSTLLPPNDARVTRVSDTTFQVSWSSRRDAARYAFVLYDESQENVLYLNEKIAGNSIEIEGLAPGTIYYYSVATAGSKRNPAIFSNPRGVRTRGTTANDLDAYHATEIVESFSSLVTTTRRETTTTTTTTVAPTTTTPPLTLCQERYASVQSFYASFPGVDGPSLPNCDTQGRFVTLTCFSDAPDVCWCVNPENGDKLLGSDFGGTNSALRLNCDRFGGFITNPIRVQVDQVQSSSMRVRWSSKRNIRGYVIVIEVPNDSDVTTMSVNPNVNFQTLNDMLSGQTYNIGVFAVNNDGWASQISRTEVRTKFIDAPEDLRITENSENSVTIRWSHSTNAESYQIRVIVSSTGQILRRFSQIVSNSFTINDLDDSLSYKIEVRAQMSILDANSVSMAHTSDAASVTLEPKQCNPSRPIDVIFVLDTSAVSSWEGLLAQRQLFTGITKNLPGIDLETGTRIAVVKYYRRASTVFNYNRFRRSNNVISTLRYLPSDSNSPLYTARMLDYVTSMFFTKDNRGPSFTKRPAATSVTIIYSAGSSENSRTEVAEAASRLKAFTNVIAVGIEGQSDDRELTAMASRPDLKITVPSLDLLNQAVDPILSKFCTLY